MMRNIYSLLLMFGSFFFFETLQAQSKGTISGQVIDRLTKETLIGANVVLEGTTTGSSTDMDGAFKIENVPPGIYNLEITYIGYDSFILTDVVVFANKTTYRTIPLNERSIEGEGILVTSGYYSNVDRKEVSTVSFNPEEIRRSPGAAQEVSRILNSVPGVSSTGDTSQDLLVRGGSVNENGFYVDNIFIPAISHFRERGGQSNGPIGLINTELVQELAFSTGGFSSSYGDRMSSVASISYKDPGQNGTQGKLGANLAGFIGELDGSLSENSGFLISARRSYLDLIANAINTGGAPRYEDYQGKLSFKLTKNHSLDYITIFGRNRFFQSRDDAQEAGETDYVDTRQSILSTGLNWKWIRTDGFSQTSLSYSNSSDDLIANKVEDQSLTVDQQLAYNALNVRNVNIQRLNNRINTEFGTDLSFEFNDSDNTFASATSQIGEQIPTIRMTDAINGTLLGVFATLNVELNSSTSLAFGSRLNWNSYNETVYVDPRFSFGHNLTSKWTINASAGIYTQTLPRFLMAQKQEFENLESTRATHLIVGTSYLLSPDTKLTFEMYNKSYTNAPQLAGTSEFGDRGFVLDRASSFFDELNSNGEAWARGVEVMLQKKMAENFYGTVSASYFRTRYKDALGDWKNRDFDNRYLVTVIGGYRPNDKWELSVRWTYLGGRPFTPVDPNASLAANETRTLTTFEAVNSQRLDAYHSLFLRFDRRWFLNNIGIVTFMEVWNAYNRANVTREYWNTDLQQVDREQQFSLLPVGGFLIEF